jgi:ABC-type multidrug transport system ATPase subunit
MLQLDRIAKRSRRDALQEISLEVVGGECVGIITEPGPLRSLMVGIAATIVRPDSGSVIIDGIDARADVFAARKRVAYAGGPADAPPGIDSGTYLAMATAGRPRLDSRDHATDLLARARIKASSELSTLTLSERYRLSVAAALQARPRVLICDSSLSGIDDSSKAFIVESLSAARDAGIAVLVASEPGGVLEFVCSRTFRLDAGRLTQRTSGERHVFATSAGLSQ